MVYRATTQRYLLLFILVVTFVRMLFVNSVTVLDAILVVFVAIGLSVNYKLKIEKDTLSYQMLILTLPIYQKQVAHDKIIEIRFKRVGWATKGAIVHVKKGFNIRVILFTPQTVFEEITQFAFENNIHITKTKDYKILETKTREIRS
uniref:DUF5673 domain-containing protein n=1 Tax=Anaerobacillus isosaccharinicus TaxID=1532552 RepID=A0A1S2LXQ6_9BACI|nr:hypothetical protein [Anaerobacillus isosaccharinicus]QOY38149.1 hypothetical protein AWH56_011775 [Anaerobacillus isosaccharinicus]